MKKSIIIIIVAIIALCAIGMGWLVLPKGHASVYVAAHDASGEDIERIKNQFAVATDGRLQLTCESSNGSYECNGSYTTNNLLQLFYYQENLFEIAENNKSIDFSSFTDGSFLATMFD